MALEVVVELLVEHTVVDTEEIAAEDSPHTREVNSGRRAVHDKPRVWKSVR